MLRLDEQISLVRVYAAAGRQFHQGFMGHFCRVQLAGQPALDRLVQGFRGGDGRSLPPLREIWQASASVIFIEQLSGIHRQYLVACGSVDLAVRRQPYPQD